MANRTRLTWPDAYYVQYAYDAQNRMLTASENGASLLAAYDYDDLGRRKSVQYGAAKAKVNYTFNGESDLLTLGHDFVTSQCGSSRKSSAAVRGSRDRRRNFGIRAAMASEIRKCLASDL